MPEVAALPVEAFLDAVSRADLDTVTARRAADAGLAVPSLRAVIAGREQVAAAVRAVLVAFPDLRYTSRSRYLAPGQVTDEAVLTGESFPVQKRPGPVPADAPLARRANCVFMGMNVRSGRARALVVATGGTASTA